MYNGLNGVHLASNIPVSIELNDVEMSYACDSDPVSCNASWETMCAMVLEASGYRDYRLHRTRRNRHKGGCKTLSLMVY